MSSDCCQMFFAMGDRTRLKILELLHKKELCVTEISGHFSMTQPSISHHLDILKRADLVRTDKRGREVYYSVNREAMYECCGKQFKAFDLLLKCKE